MKVLIIEGHKLFAEGLRLLLESYQEDVETAYAKDYESASEVIYHKMQPDLILLDISLSGVTDFSLIDKLHKINIWTPILVISSSDSPSDVNIALEKGASGFVSKTSHSKIFLQAIETVIYGDVYKGSHENPDLGGLYRTTKVTSRQFEVLMLLSQGMLNKQIAIELEISANTVKAHIHDIFKVLQVNNRTAAVNYAYKHGLL